MCLLGASGCGKTTTLKMISGFLKTDKGQILVDGQFEISDGRSVDEVYQALLSNNMQPVMSDYIYV